MEGFPTLLSSEVVNSRPLTSLTSHIGVFALNCGQSRIPERGGGLTKVPLIASCTTLAHAYKLLGSHRVWLNSAGTILYTPYRPKFKVSPKAYIYLLQLDPVRGLKTRPPWREPCLWPCFRLFCRAHPFGFNLLALLTDFAS